MGPWRTGGDHDPVQVLLRDSFGDLFLAILRAGEQVAFDIDHIVFNKIDIETGISQVESRLQTCNPTSDNHYRPNFSLVLHDSCPFGLLSLRHDERISHQFPQALDLDPEIIFLVEGFHDLVTAVVARCND